MSTTNVKPIGAPSRMSLASVTRIRKPEPMRILLYGIEKVGKTTFAAGAPNPVFICPENGIPVSLGDVAFFPSPEDGWTWQDVIDAVRELETGDHTYQTLVLDTLDWLEPILWRHVCEAARVGGIEEVGGGYGKGYTAALDGWRFLLAALERVRARRGMHVVMLAHSWIRPFKDPQSEGYDRHELKIHKGAAGLLKEWSDAVIFALHDDTTTKDARTKRVRGVSTGSRVLLTVHHAAYDAGNRYDLPEELPLSWDDFHAAVQAHAPASPELLRTAVRDSISRLTDATRAEKATAAIGRAGEDASKLAKLNDLVNAWLRSQQEKTE